jgi:acetolactate synthase-1/2/3 large subunit
MRTDLKNVSKTVSEVIADALCEFGVTDIFCVVGGAIAPLSNVFATDQRFNIHYLLHEQSAGIAAESYSAAIGKPSVLLVTSGPGTTNVMTPLVAAWTNSTPLIVIAGQVRSVDVHSAGENRQWGGQHVDSVAMSSQFTKSARQISSESVMANFVSDLTLSVSGRHGPVWFEVPVDVQRSQARQVYSVSYQTEPIGMGELDNFVYELKDSLQKCKRPVILLGNGCRKNLQNIRKLISDLGIPTQLTWPALDFLQYDDALYAGRPGSISTWGANLTLQAADLVIVLGARLDWGQVAFRPENFAAKAKIFRVEVDVEELRRIPAANTVDACASIEDFLKCANELNLVESLSKNNYKEWLSIVKIWKDELSTLGSTNPISQISMYDLLNLVSKHSDLFPTVVSGSSGTCTEQVMQAINPKKDQRILNSGGFGSMGFGVAGAIGAYYATKNPVLCLESDGSFSMNPQDIAHIVNNDLPIRILIMDSLGYKSIYLSQIRGNYAIRGVNQKSGVGILDSSKVAESMGMRSAVTSLEQDWQNDVKQFLGQISPQLLRVIVSSEEEAAPRVLSKPNAEGRMETSKLDDLWPELTANQFDNFIRPWNF